MALKNTEERPLMWKTLQGAKWWANRLKRYHDPKDIKVEGSTPEGYFVVVLYSTVKGTDPDILVNGSEVYKHLVRLDQTL
jgi:hypothetical protein